MENLMLRRGVVMNFESAGRVYRIVGIDEVGDIGGFRTRYLVEAAGSDAMGSPAWLPVRDDDCRGVMTTLARYVAEGAWEANQPSRQGPLSEQ